MGAGLTAVLAFVGYLAWKGLAPTRPPAPPLQARPAPAPQAVASRPTPAAELDLRVQQTGAWLAAAPTTTHVIQVATAKEAARAAVLLEDLDRTLPPPVRVLYGLSRGSPAWMFVTGEFPDRAAALAALPNLPAGVTEEPFLRTVGRMRTVVLPTGQP